LKKLRVELSEMMKKLEKSESELGTTKNTLVEKDGDITEITAKYVSIQTLISELKNDLPDTCKNTLNDKETKMNTKIEKEIQNIKSSFDIKLKSLEQQHVLQQSELEKLKKDLQKKHKDFDHIMLNNKSITDVYEETNKRTNDKIKILESMQKELDENINKLEETTINIKKDIDEVNDDVNKLFKDTNKITLKDMINKNPHAPYLNPTSKQPQSRFDRFKDNFHLN
jgi:chromosome segregation ATPase